MRWHEPAFLIVVAQTPVEAPPPHPDPSVLPQSHAMTHPSCHHDNRVPFKPLSCHKCQRQLVCLVVVAQLADASPAACSHAASRQQQGVISTQATIIAGDPPNDSLTSRVGQCLASTSPCPSFPYFPQHQLHNVPFAVTQTECCTPAAIRTTASSSNTSRPHASS